MLRIYGLQLGLDLNNKIKSASGVNLGPLAQTSPKELETYLLKLVFPMPQGMPPKRDFEFPVP